MSELFMECEEEELEPWQKPAPQQVLIEDDDDDDEPIFVGVVCMYTFYENYSLGIFSLHALLRVGMLCISAGQPQQLIQRFAPVTTAVPGVVHRPHVQQIRNNVVTLANVQNPTVYTAKPRLLQVSQATSLQTIALPGQANSLNKGVPLKANVTKPLENGDIKKNCPNCKEEFLQQEALDCHMTVCLFVNVSFKYFIDAKVEGNALLANNIVTYKRIMLVSEFYYGRFEGDPLKASLQRSSVTFKCQSCCKVLKSNIKFMNHMKHHLELEKQNNESWESHITCQHCYRQYTTPFHLQCHIESAHSPIESSTNCKICELAFESEQVLLEHMKDNHKPGEMPYVCQVCNYRSSFFSDVETHFRSAHVNTKDLLCPFCLRILRNGQCYMHHFMKHQKKGIHRCGKCRLNFLTYKDRIDHRAQVHKTFRKPSVLEGLPAGTKVTIRASLSAKTVAMSSSVDRSAVVLTPETLSNSAKIKPGGLAKSKRNTSEAVKPKTVLKNKGNSCNTKIDDFSSHFLLSSDCGACNYRTSCKVAIGNHMISQNALKRLAICVSHLINGCFSCRLTLVCLNCDLLVDASGGDVMSKHLNDRTNHICKVIEEKGMRFEACNITLCSLTVLKSSPTETTFEPVQIEKMEHLPHTKVEQLQPLAVLPAAPEDSVGESAMQSVSSAVEDSPSENVMQSVSSAVEDSQSENVMQADSSSCALDGVEDVEPIGDLNIMENSNGGTNRANTNKLFLYF
uniref:Zinc finger protein 280D n=1 Tax=Hippocampus comes TaxID=109280 RepID=A0A3Q2XEC4_HIPCM